MVNKKRVIKLLRNLIQINSENPPGDERRVALYLEKILKGMGLATRLYEFKKNRINVIGVLKSAGAGKTLLLTPHSDTVPAGDNWRFAPFAGTIYKNRIYGRGTSDCKGNIACGIEAIKSLSEDKIRLEYNLVFAVTCDEETGSHFGLLPLLKRGILKPDAAVILDADDFSIIIAQKGLIHFKVKIFGKKAHGAYPEKGINAIEISSKIIRALKLHRFLYKRHPLLKKPTINIGTIAGGDKVNMVADWCEFQVDLRFLPGMSEQNILNEIKNIIKRFVKKYKIQIQDIQSPFAIDKNHFLVNNLTYALKANRLPVKIKGSEGATVITFFQTKNIPAVATGAAVSGMAHTTDEYITTDNLVCGAELLDGLLRRFSFA